LSLVTVFVVFLAVSLFTSLFLFQGIAGFLLDSLEKKIDISVYFKDGISETDILDIREELLSSVQGIKNIDYVSPEQALARFQERHQYNDAIKQALAEVGGNPFPASLNIRVDEGLKFEAVAQFLSDPLFQDQIEQVDYYQRKPVIEKFYSLKSGLEKTGLVVALLLAFIAFSITFITIRLAIYSAGDEIGIMRLVGASNWFIRGPFLIQGIICGAGAILAGLICFSLLSFFFSAQLFDLTGGFNLFNYFLSHFFVVLGLQVLSGVGLVSFSSLVAIRKYLEK